MQTMCLSVNVSFQTGKCTCSVTGQYKEMNHQGNANCATQQVHSTHFYDQASEIVRKNLTSGTIAS